MIIVQLWDTTQIADGAQKIRVVVDVIFIVLMITVECILGLLKRCVLHVIVSVSMMW